MADVLQVSGTWRAVGRIGVASGKGPMCPFENRATARKIFFGSRYCTVQYHRSCVMV